MKNPQNILLVGNFTSRTSGVISQSEELAIYLSNLGWHVMAVSSYANKLLRFVNILWTVIFRRKDYFVVCIDVFSSNLSLYLVEVVVFFLRCFRKPYMLTLHGGGLPEFSKRWPGRVAKLLEYAYAVTTPSHFIKQEFYSFCENIVYLPNGIDLQKYHFRLRKRPNPNLCWLRAFHQFYNPNLAIEVLALLKEKYSDIQLTMIGPDRKDGSLETVLTQLELKGLTDHVRIVGAIPKADIPNWLDKYDIYLNTTRYESFGVAVMEAAALGLPIVTTNVGELPYLWVDEEEALLVPCDDAKTMADAVERVLTEQGLAERLSRNARAKAEGFDWSAILPQWENLIQEVLDSA